MYVHVSFGGFGVSETAMFGGMLDQMLLHNGKPRILWDSSLIHWTCKRQSTCLKATQKAEAPDSGDGMEILTAF
jgi:hypothetical protein